ncbi:PTS system IIA component, L-Asc family [Pasteurella testudinis DSM 23072]|uniref:PTS system IIA component, L-Asc family n=1 Tax=Pasteurella testudinis DSM 23072 TaxID=1122938 RepID=A0A1W1UEF5_9PAST|nr:PTS sugar transporter subunit IIA [Pasteurella testudinis]SMB79476.1 PTS system IIA component, L-Asc family [Pasteurella testudinis DSM 23072]SUB50757.1 ascorbate-specific phosphotransferase enzyme IIA component [Pasteurella testudinis]
MLKSYLPLAHIQLVESVSDWQQAVKQCAQPLLGEQLIEPRYLDRIFQLYEEIGPYFVIAPQIAMPHARPEDGALDQALSLLVIKQGIDFGSENDPVKLLILLAAKDNSSHLDMLAAVAELLADESAVEEMIGAADIEHIAAVVHRY